MHTRKNLLEMHDMKTLDDTQILDVLGVPPSEERPWATFASCTTIPGMTFFPQNKREEAIALAVCAACPVRVECLGHALATNERFGVWGGTTEKERRSLARIG